MLKDSRLLAALLPLALICLPVAPAAAASGAPSTVGVRVLGAGPAFPTLLALTEVTTATAAVEKAGGSCAGTSAAGALELATGGNWEGKWNSGFGDYEVISIEGQAYPFEPESNKNYFWSLWLNGRETPTGICGTALETGDQVLFFPSCFGSECPAPPSVLVLEGPAAVEPGVPVAFTVLSYPSSGGEPAPAAEATVSAEGVSGQADPSGHATLTFTRAGSFAVHATAGPAVPGEARICVHAGNDGSCGRNSVRMNHLVNFDWSLFKETALTEGGFWGSAPLTLQLRAEAYNVFNTPFLTAQSDNWRTVSSPSFGLYNAAGSTRRLQFAVRLTW